MDSDNIGTIVRISGAKISVKISATFSLQHINIKSFATNYVSIGSLVGTRLIDGRILVLTTEELYDNSNELFY